MRNPIPPSGVGRVSSLPTDFVLFSSPRMWRPGFIPYRTDLGGCERMSAASALGVKDRDYGVVNKKLNRVMTTMVEVGIIFLLFLRRLILFIGHIEKKNKSDYVGLSIGLSSMHSVTK